MIYFTYGFDLNWFALERKSAFKYVKLFWDTNRPSYYVIYTNEERTLLSILNFWLRSIRITITYVPLILHAWMQYAWFMTWSDDSLQINGISSILRRLHMLLSEAWNMIYMKLETLQKLSFDQRAQNTSVRVPFTLFTERIKIIIWKMDSVNFPIYFTVAVVAIIFIVYKWATQNDAYFVKRGVPALRPALFFGNSREFFTKQIDLIEFVQKLYNDFPAEK